MELLSACIALTGLLWHTPTSHDFVAPYERLYVKGVRERRGGGTPTSQVMSTTSGAQSRDTALHELADRGMGRPLALDPKPAWTNTILRPSSVAFIVGFSYMDVAELAFNIGHMCRCIWLLCDVGECCCRGRTHHPIKAQTLTCGSGSQIICLGTRNNGNTHNKQ